MLRHAPCLLLLALLLVEIGCASAPARRRPRTRVQPPPPTRLAVGMSKAQVENMLGTPDRYSGSGVFETWRYEQRTARHTSDLVTIVHFRRGTVASFEVNAPRDEVERPLLRPAPPGGSPHHGAPVSPAPVVDPHAPASGHHTPVVAPPVGGVRDNRGVPVQPCRRSADCGPGRECRARADNVLVCMGQGEPGMFCLQDDHCQRGLRCRPGRDGLLTCQ